MKALLFTLLFVGSAQASVGFVEQSQFEVGRSWVWQHAELDSRTGTWVPHLHERYTVAAISGSKITIEMSSDPPSAKYPSAPHHKFKFDFKNCEAAKTDASKRAWTVEFYTTSITGTWSLVSQRHTNFVFTEKFNCFSPTATEVVRNGTFSLPDAAYPTFQTERGIAGDTGWYMKSHPELTGVLASKVFEPTRKYRAELFLNSRL